MNPKILIIELESQYTLVIARILRELGFRSAILAPTKALTWLRSHKPKAIILSGGKDSVYAPNAPSPPREILNTSIPILGICYGMQWLVQTVGGQVLGGGEGNYGETEVSLNPTDPLFYGVRPKEIVWASHGDSAAKLSGFKCIGTSGNGTVMAVRLEGRLVWGVQFHPEVKETLCGKKLFENFLDIAKVERDWSPQDLVQNIRHSLVELVKGRRIIAGMSGGVDSSTLLAIAAPLFKENLLGILISGGQLRLREEEMVLRTAKQIGLPFRIIETGAFIANFGVDIDAEQKRAIFRNVYKNIFAEEVESFGAKVILQGSLAPDFIESGETGGDCIKSHHNVGLSVLGCESIHPFRNLFKYEVRELARSLELPDDIVEKEPFPGPGLFVRIVGVPITKERLDLIRWADAEVRVILHKSGEIKEISQLVVALLGVHLVGVKGDKRVYKPAIGVRAVTSLDFMTAKGYQISSAARKMITSTLTKHRDISHVGFFEADKPPATVEFE